MADSLYPEELEIISKIDGAEATLRNIASGHFKGALDSVSQMVRGKIDDPVLTSTIDSLSNTDLARELHAQYVRHNPEMKNLSVPALLSAIAIHDEGADSSGGLQEAMQKRLADSRAYENQYLEWHRAALNAMRYGNHWARAQVSDLGREAFDENNLRNWSKGRHDWAMGRIQEIYPDQVRDHGLLATLNAVSEVIKNNGDNIDRPWFSASDDFRSKLDQQFIVDQNNADINAARQVFNLKHDKADPNEVVAVNHALSLMDDARIFPNGTDGKNLSSGQLALLAKDFGNVFFNSKADGRPFVDLFGTDRKTATQNLLKVMAASHPEDERLWDTSLSKDQRKAQYLALLYKNKDSVLGLTPEHATPSMVANEPSRVPAERAAAPTHGASERSAQLSNQDAQVTDAEKVAKDLLDKAAEIYRTTTNGNMKLFAADEMADAQSLQSFIKDGHKTMTEEDAITQLKQHQLLIAQHDGVDVIPPSLAKIKKASELGPN